MAKDISPQDLAKLTGSIDNLRRSMENMVTGVRALNTNLVAIHEQMKEKNEQQ